MWDRIKYEFLPFLKVRVIFTWWAVRYGGVKNIPPQKIAARMERNIQRTRESLYNALRAIPTDATDEERQMLLDAIREADEIERIYREGLKNREH